jgi:hypothetical protein
MPIAFGRVPHPPMEIRHIIKPEGQGWDNLGKRTPRAIVLHRMIGTLKGTDGYFREPGVNSLTDYGVGVLATDGASLAGKIYQWNDPRGTRSGWANGRVSKPYDDGLKFINRYGITGVNRDCVSCEISGNYDTKLDDAAVNAIAGLMAYWADQYSIPHTDFPLVKSEDRSFVIWHQEFTIGTGKVCPGAVVMTGTNDLIARAKEIMKRHQETTGSFVQPEPTPIWTGYDEVRDDTKYYAIERRVKAKAGASFHAWASDSASHTRARASEGEVFRVSWAVLEGSEWWWVTPHGSRVKMSSTDTQVAFKS